MLSVYTRHHPDRKNAGDKRWRRCSCPKWIWGSLDGKFIRRSARTHRWEEAEELRQHLTEGLPPAPLQDSKPTPTASTGGLDRTSPAAEPLPQAPKRPRVTIRAAVDAYLADAVSRNVAEATLDKLETIFRKQFLAWTQDQDFAYIDEIELDALLNFRYTKPRPVHPPMCLYRRTWSTPSRVFPQAPDPIRATSSGAVTAILKAPLPTGSAPTAACSSWRTSEQPTRRGSGATLTCSVTP